MELPLSSSSASSDLSLIEMSTEDDSLLQLQLTPTPTPTPTALPDNNNNIISDFTISPLHHFPHSSHHSLASNTSEEKHYTDKSKLDWSSSYMNKENLDTTDNRSSTSNLRIEPQRMKRGRKGGGYNSRKSLAWDRAFLTEEGVLNPLELSLISGAFDKLDGDSLSTIDEQQGDVSTIDSGSVGGTANLRTLEEDLFKELPPVHPSEPKKTSRLELKQHSSINVCLASASKASQRASQHPGQKAAAKGGTSINVTHSSQKQVSSMSNTKTTNRYSKIPKCPTRRDSSSATVTASHTAGPKCAGLRTLSDTKVGAVTSKLGPGCTSKSSKPPRDLCKDVTKASPETPLLSNHQADHTTRIRKLSEVVSSKGMHADGVDKSFKGSNSTNTSSKRFSPGVTNADMTNKVTCSTTNPSQYNFKDAGGYKKEVGVQGVKPSGLRMPSPSLRFFSETKVTVTDTPHLGTIMSSKIPKSSIPSSTNIRSIKEVPKLKFKPAPGGPTQEAAGKGRLGLQTDTCSSFSTANSEKHHEEISAELARQDKKAKLPVDDKKSSPQKGTEKSKSETFDDANIQDTWHLQTSLRDEVMQPTLTATDTPYLGDVMPSKVPKFPISSSTNIRAMDEIQVFKFKEAPGGPDQMAAGKAGLSLQIDKHSISSPADGKELNEVKLTDVFLQEEKELLPVGDRKSPQSVSEQSKTGTFDSFKNQDAGHVQNFDMDEAKDEHLALCSVGNHETSIVFQKLRTSGENTSGNSPVLCHEEHQISSNEKDKEAESQVVGNMGFDSLVKKSEAIPFTHKDSVSDKIDFTWSSNAPSSSHLHYNEHGSICQIVSDESITAQIDVGHMVPGDKSSQNLSNSDSTGEASANGEVAKEVLGSQLPHDFDGKKRDNSADSCIIGELDNSMADEYQLVNKQTYTQVGGQFVIEGSMTRPIDLGPLPVCKFAQTLDVDVTTEKANSHLPHSCSDDEEMEPCSVPCNTKADNEESVGYECHSVDNTQDDRTVDEIANVNFAICSEDDKGRRNGLLMTRSFFCLEDTDLALESSNYVSTDISSGSLQVPSDKGSELSERDSQSQCCLLELSSHDAVKVQTSQRSELVQCIHEYGVPSVNVSDPTASIAYIERTKVANDENNHLDSKLLPTEEFLVNDTFGASAVLHMDCVMTIAHSSSERNQERRKIGIADELNKVFSSNEKVELETGSITSLSTDANDCTDPIDLLLSQSCVERRSDSAAHSVADCDSEEFFSPDKIYYSRSNHTLIDATHEECTHHSKAESNSLLSGTAMIEEKGVDCINNQEESSKLPSKEDQKLAGLANAIPFSEEWLAAVEAAGEEILTLKTGAVQNSPPDKSIPEPSPWSPVKREIGPFDCTKYSSAQPNPP